MLRHSLVGCRVTARRAMLAFLALALTAGPAGMASAADRPADDRTARLPLFETPAGGASDSFVVLYSGDSGWGAAAQGFAVALASRGAPVIGVDSLRYFIRRRSPADAAADLAALIDRYAARWNRREAILVGYSFGADALPLIVQALPAPERARVRLVALISPAARGDLAFRVVSWFDMTLPGARPLAPALATLPPIPALCIEASRDPRAACDRFPSALITSVRLPGDHRYGGEYDAVADAIIAASGAATARRLEPAPISQEKQ
jgi:type IV secretory pathway VirJ component